MPNIDSTSPDEKNATVLAAIEDLLIEMRGQGEERNDTNERIQQQLAKMNEDENLIAGERHYE